MNRNGQSIARIIGRASGYPNHRLRLRAFTLVEVMVSMVVLAIMLMLIAQIIGQTQRSWRMASTRLSQFREARIAFDTITRNLRQSTLDAYRDFVYSTGNNIPKSNRPDDFPVGYKRYAELAFVSGQADEIVKVRSGGGNIDKSSLSGHAVFFQAPLGVTDPDTSPKENGRPKYENLKNLLCVRGYFVQFGSDKTYLPKALDQAGRLTETNRFRLMEYQPPAEQNDVYSASAEDDWRKVDTTYVRPVSDRIVGLILSPRLSSGSESVKIGGSSQIPTSIAPKYSYDSNKVSSVSTANPQGTQYLLPPVVKVTMIAVDDASMAALAKEGKPNVLSDSGGSFTTASAYETDMEKLRQYLNGKKVNYRIFEASVVIPASRWAL